MIEDTCKFKYLITGNKLQFGPSEQCNAKRKQNSGAVRGASNVPILTAQNIKYRSKDTEETQLIPLKRIPLFTSWTRQMLN